MKKAVILLLMVCVCVNFISAKQTNTSEKKSNIALNVAIKNRHLWRGQESIKGLTLQGSLTYNLPFLTVGAWGGYELDAHSYAEVDVFLKAYFAKYFTIGIYDFYRPYGTDGYNKRSFSDFSSSSNNHVIDCFLSYSGTESFPLGALVGTYVYGNDKDAEGKQRYSTYLEVNYTLQLTEKSNMFFYLGATTSKESAYAAKETIMLNGIKTLVPVSNHNFNLIGLGSKYTRYIKIGKFNTNVSGEFLYNPNIDIVYMALSASITL